jgi:hypothetical protein
MYMLQKRFLLLKANTLAKLFRFILQTPLSSCYLEKVVKSSQGNLWLSITWIPALVWFGVMGHTP